VCIHDCDGICDIAFLALCSCYHVVRKAEFDKHVEDDDDEDTYPVDDLNLEGDPGGRCDAVFRIVLTLPFSFLFLRYVEADVWDADSEYLDYLAKEASLVRKNVIVLSVDSSCTTLLPGCPSPSPRNSRL
jgi:hypothetical protein